MIRFRFGVGILALVLAGGIAAMLFMGHIHGDICEDLQEAADFGEDR